MYRYEHTRSWGGEQSILGCASPRFFAHSHNKLKESAPNSAAAAAGFRRNASYSLTEQYSWSIVRALPAPDAAAAVRVPLFVVCCVVSGANLYVYRSVHLVRYNKQYTSE